MKINYQLDEKYKYNLIRNKKNIPSKGVYIFLINRLVKNKHSDHLNHLLKNALGGRMSLFEVDGSIKKVNKKTFYHKITTSLIQDNQSVAICFDGQIQEHKRQMRRIFKTLRKTIRNIKCDLIPIGINSKSMTPINIGTLITADFLASQGSRSFRKILLFRLQLLHDSTEHIQHFTPDRKIGSSLAEEISADILESEILKLPLDHCLIDHSPYKVYKATIDQIPNAILEIGRLREYTFRLVGEGTNKMRDNDEYDLYYETAYYMG